MEYMIIRGSRILQQLAEIELMELSTVPQLTQNIRSAWPNTKKRQNATGEVRIGNIEYIPYVGTRMLHARTTSTSNGHQYTQAIQFLDIKFEPVDTKQNATITATDGKDYHMQPVKLSHQNAKVRCSCMDFYWRFANYNSADKSLVGRPPALYQRKTNRPPVNPDQVPGLCKHLLKFVDQLRGIRLVR